MKVLLAAAAAISLCASSVLADTVTLKNGDKINGTVGQIADGKMSFKSPVLGDITIDMANVQTYTTDAPVPIRMKGETPTVTDQIKSADAEKIETAGGQTIAASDVKAINPPPQKWSGSIVANATLARGNTDTLTIGVTAAAGLRRDDERNDDRFTFGGGYNFGTTGIGDDSETTTDNWNAYGQYDRFWTEKWYGYAGMKAEHDRIAALNYRLTPGVGVGYQWIEQADMHFHTEVGVTYVYEDFTTGGDDDFVALRLAYHFDKELSETVGIFHNLEWLPAFEDPSDYILTTDIGLRADLTTAMFSEFKIEYKRDSEPAPGSEKDDLRFILGIGWRF